jgi:hypothetical protein
MRISLSQSRKGSKIDESIDDKAKIALKSVIASKICPNPKRAFIVYNKKVDNKRKLDKQD